MTFRGVPLIAGIALSLGIASPAMAGDVAAPPGSCTVSSWSAEWGVKESFRSYLSGSIAQGEWTTDGNVTYTTPLFTIHGDSGWMSPDGSSGVLTTEGSIRFVGHGGILDQTLSSPSLVIGESIHLVFDVVGDTREGVSVNQEAVNFVVIDHRPTIDQEASTWTLSHASTELTEAGAEAFGNYPAGTTFDPIEVSATVESGCLEEPSGALAWVVSLSVVASAIGAVVTVWARKRRGQ